MELMSFQSNNGSGILRLLHDHLAAIVHNFEDYQGQSDLHFDADHMLLAEAVRKWNGELQTILGKWGIETKTVAWDV